MLSNAFYRIAQWHLLVTICVFIIVLIVHYLGKLIDRVMAKNASRWIMICIIVVIAWFILLQYGLNLIMPDQKEPLTISTHIAGMEGTNRR